MRSSTVQLSALLFALQATGLGIPSNVQNLYNSIKASGSCKNVLQGGFFALDNGPGTFSYCGDHLNDYGIVYLQGTGGALADMDIDCDGLQHGPGDDGRCGNSGDTQSQTSFEDTVASYRKGVSDLNAFVHPYVVFGNVGNHNGQFTEFDPTSVGIQPLSVMAVVCNGQMYYGIWGDENGDDGDKSMIGEASISIATLCFGTSVNGNSGHEQTDVLYIAFTGNDAVPGANGANWAATNVNDFESSITSLGNKLVQRIGGGGIVTSTTKRPTSTTVAPPSGTCAACEWAGHCIGASCSTADDCDGDLTCDGGFCGGCTWEGHCLCASCSTGDDCADDLVCTSGRCANP
ncbi:family 75 glycoside hydrolase [Xylogone sp. PMI_703]|nr:family 75 glycoside hydrolase [Xylogone sp. PMI_703]